MRNLFLGITLKSGIYFVPVAVCEFECTDTEEFQTFSFAGNELST
jgi:hypothetical protein